MAWTLPRPTHLLKGRISSAPKPGIHMFQFLSSTIWGQGGQEKPGHLHVPHVYVGGLPVLGEGAGLAHRLLDEVIRYL